MSDLSHLLNARGSLYSVWRHGWGFRFPGLSVSALCIDLGLNFASAVSVIFAPALRRIIFQGLGWWVCPVPQGSEP